VARNLCLGFILGIFAQSIAAQAETITVAALGDSLTQGYGLVQEDGFTAQLQDWLRAQGADVDVINAGVSGDTTAGGLSRVAWTLTPDVDNLDGILAAGQGAGVDMLLVGMEAPLNYGADYKADFDLMYPELATAYDIQLYPTFFDGLIQGDDISGARATFMQADGIHPNRDGVARIVAAMGPVVLAVIGD